MNLNRTERQEASDPMARIYEELEARLMSNIVRHIRDYGRPVDSDRWRFEKLAEIGRLNEENMRIIAASAAPSQKAAREMCFQMAGQALARTRSSGEGEEMSAHVREAVKKVYDQVWESLNSSNTTLLYQAANSYRRLVGDICSGDREEAVAKDFREILGEEAAKEAMGAQSRSQALEAALRRFNEEGIAAFFDRAGRKWTPEAYSSMVLRTAAQNAASEALFARMEERGYHLIQVSSHSGARPKCAGDQGKIFDRNNGSGYTVDRNGKKLPYYPLSSSSYGEPDGLFGINCGHHGVPFIPGVSRERYIPTGDLEENDEEYRKIQTQRELERRVRKQKRLCMLYREAGDQEALAKARKALRGKEQKLRDYVNSQENLVRRPEREQVPGWDKKDTEAGKQPKAVLRGGGEEGRSVPEPQKNRAAEVEEEKERGYTEGRSGG